MGPQLNTGHPDDGPVVHCGKATAGFDPMAELLFPPALLDVLALCVPDGNADGATVCGTLPQQLIESRIRLMQEDCGVDENVNALPRCRKQVHKGCGRHVGPLLVQRDQFGTHRPCCACLPQCRPESEHVFPYRLSGTHGGFPARGAT